ncbi:MAG: ubiquitin-like small modifier protein 1 [Thermoproteota archaeon]
MAKVRVKFFASYQKMVGEREVEVEVPEGATVLDLARKLEKTYPQLRGVLLDGDRLSEEPRILINGRNIEWLGQENARLKDGDTVAIFPPAAGGVGTLFAPLA